MAMSGLCMVCKVLAPSGGWSTCEPCRRDRAARAREHVAERGAGAVLAELAALPDPTVEDLAQLEADLEPDPPVEPEPAVGPPVSGPFAPDLFFCDQCAYSTNRAQSLGVHRHRVHGYRRDRPVEPSTTTTTQEAATDATTAPPPLGRFYDLIDLAVGWSRLTPAHQIIARTVLELPSDEQQIVARIAARINDRTSQIFDQLRAGT